MKKILLALFVAVLTVAFAAPAMAAMKVGGIGFVDFFWWSQSKELMALKHQDPIYEGRTSPSLESDNTSLTIQLNHISRFYFRWTNEDNVGLYMETYVDDAPSDALGTRHAYGWWDFTPTWRIMVGKSTTPFSPLNPSTLMGLDDTAKIIGIGYGDFYSGRFSQVRFQYKYPNNLGFLRIAMVDPRTTSSLGWPDKNSVSSGATYMVDNESVIPRFDVGSPLYFGSVKLYPSFFWHKQDYDDVLAGQADTSFTAYGLSLGINWVIGPVNIQAEINGGRNWANTRGLGLPLAYVGQTAFAAPIVAWASGAAVDSHGNVYDADLLSWWIDLSFKLGPATPHLMYGRLDGERDGSADGQVIYVDYATWMAGVSVPIALAKGFSIRPEVMVYDNGGENQLGQNNFPQPGYTALNVDFGRETLFGLQFQITF